MRAIPKRPWDECFANKKERLRRPESWYPFPLLIPFVLEILLISHMLFGTTSRIGNPADVLSFPANRHKIGPIWFSVTPVNGQIVVTTEDRQIFRWAQSTNEVASIKPFRDYLVKKSQDMILASALSKQALRSKTRAVIAADQRLKFMHMKPILYALATANISQYGFETKIPLTKINADHLDESNF